MPSGGLPHAKFIKLPVLLNTVVVLPDSTWKGRYTSSLCARLAVVRNRISVTTRHADEWRSACNELTCAVFMLGGVKKLQIYIIISTKRENKHE